MDELRIRLFGELHVSFESESLPAFPTHHARSLFAFLVLRRERPVDREVLCGHFWGERGDAEARKALRTTLWRVRQVLRPFEARGGRGVRAEGSQICFHGPAWVDVEEFQDCLDEPGRRPGPDGDDDPCHRLARAACLYRADFLEGIYEDWCQSEREPLRLRFFAALERLVECHAARGEWREAIWWGSELLRRDPLREHVHRSLMVCHLANGDRPSALRQFRVCVRVLADELGIEPMEETERLHRSIRAGSAIAGSIPLG
jgi:DNA-binding SARP family transcriptional activator